MLIISICKCFLASLAFLWLKLKSQQFFQEGGGGGSALQPETKVLKDRTEPFYN